MLVLNSNMHEIKAITGHTSDAEMRRYTEKSDRIPLTDRALAKLQRRGSKPKCANRADKVIKHKG